MRGEKINTDASTQKSLPSSRLTRERPDSILTKFLFAQIESGHVTARFRRKGVSGYIFYLLGGTWAEAAAAWRRSKGRRNF